MTCRKAAVLLALSALATAPQPRAVMADGPVPSEAYARIATWTSGGEPEMPGLFKAPSGIDVGPDGTIYVVDSRLEAVHVLAPDGTPVGLWGGRSSGLALGAIQDVAVGEDRVFVSEPDGDRVHLFALDGRYDGAWPVRGQPVGLAHSGGELYVTTRGNREVVVLGPDGLRRRSWDPDTSPLVQPWGIDIGPIGRVYVTDLAATRVWIFEPLGVLVGGLAAVIDGVEVAPIDVAVDDDGDVFILTEFKLIRQRHGVDVGRPVDSPGGRGVAVGPGSGLVAAVQDHRIGFTGVRHVPDRRAIQPEFESWGNPFAPLGTLEAPRRLSANAFGRVFLLDTWPRIQSWRSDGTPQSQFGAGALHDLAASLRGSVWGIDGHELGYWTEDGSPLWRWAPPSTDPQTGLPYGWLTGLDGFGGELAVLDLADQRVHIRDFSGNPLADWPVAPPDGFDSIADLALTADRVYLVNRNHRQVEVRDRDDGTLIDRWSVPGVVSRVDADDDGRVFLLTREGWVWKRAPDGTDLAVWRAADDGSATDLAAGQDGRAYVSIGGQSEVGVFAPDPKGVPVAPPEIVEHCALRHDKTASPGELQLGDSVEVRLTIEGECPLADARSDILLLVDTSGSMSGGKMGAARSAALEFIGQLDYSLSQVGLVSFSTEVELVQPLTSNPRQLIRAVPTLGDDAGTNMYGAFELTELEFASERARPEARQVVVLLTDGRPNTGRAELLDMAARYREMGRDVYAVGLGLDVDRRFLEGMVTQANYYFEAPSEHDLSRIYDTIAGRVAASVLLAHSQVADELPANMRYLRGSASPPARYDAIGRTLSWDVAGVPPAGLTLRYRVEPLEAGLHPTNVYAAADYIDGVGQSGRLTFPVPEVRVVRPQHWALYLPLLMRRKCPELQADIVLALDTSSSMRTPPAPGMPTKLDAAIRAARVFLGQVQLPQDRVAIVAFNAEAKVVQPLTGDHPALVQAMDALPTGIGTRLDLGLEAARGVLDDRLAGHLPVVILLTDGRQSGEQAAVYVAAAGTQAAGITLFTVGLGDDADLALLALVAGDARRAYFAPTEAELADIYRQIAGAIPCQ